MVGGRRDEIAHMLMAGVPPPKVAIEIGVSRSFVYRIQRGLDPSPANAEDLEDAMMANAQLEQERRWETVRVSRRCLRCGNRLLWNFDALECICCGAYYS